MMTRKHFKQAAEAIKLTRPNPARDLAQLEPGERCADIARGNACHEIAHHLADLFAEDNPRFDRQKFIEATLRD